MKTVMYIILNKKHYIKSKKLKIKSVNYFAIQKNSFRKKHFFSFITRRKSKKPDGDDDGKDVSLFQLVMNVNLNS